MDEFEHTADAETLDAATAAGRPRGDGMLRLAKGDELGRYVVLRPLGAGAMGAVYLAYDPELDRKLAIKMLRGAGVDSDGRALQREAQVMAKLRHPNVVSVHDVGEHEGRVYVAMEFVEGETLRSWLSDRSRSWREVLELFLAAGRGLLAAHERELIHRDFKPDNVMVSSAGEVMVMDFGLARPSADAPTPSIEEVELDTASGSLLTEATVGHIAGTPAYMAPEQVQAEQLSPAADQFAFCVSLWEALCGQRPFGGRSLVELYTNISEGQLRRPPAGTRMPRWLERVLLRGLAREPEQRWPSMAELLAALDRGRGRWRWQLAIGALTIVALSVGVGLDARRREARAHQAKLERCANEGRAIDATWNDEARVRLRAGLLDSEASFANESVDTLLPWLDAYAEAWAAGKTQACVHAEVEGDWTPRQRDQADWCFEDRRLQLEATVDQIASLDRAAARRAVRIASYLDPVETCLEPAALSRLPVPPAEMRAEIRAIRAELVAVDRERHVGRYAEALELAQAAMKRAEALGWPPLVASARFYVGRCLLRTGRVDDADAALTRTYFEALDAGSVEVAFRSARSLILVQASLDRYREALLWSRHAEALGAELSDPMGLDEAEGHYLLNVIYRGLGDYAAAIEHGQRAVELRAEALGAEHPITAAAVANLGLAYLGQGRPGEALELFERTAAVYLDALGPDHPYVGNLAMYRARALLALGQRTQARSHAEQGLAIYREALQPDHPRTRAAVELLAAIEAGVETEALSSPK